MNMNYMKNQNNITQDYSVDTNRGISGELASNIKENNIYFQKNYKSNCNSARKNSDANDENTFF